MYKLIKCAKFEQCEKFRDDDHSTLFFCNHKKSTKDDVKLFMYIIRFKQAD